MCFRSAAARSEEKPALNMEESTLAVDRGRSLSRPSMVRGRMGVWDTILRFKSHHVSIFKLRIIGIVREKRGRTQKM